MLNTKRRSWAAPGARTSCETTVVLQSCDIEGESKWRPAKLCVDVQVERGTTVRTSQLAQIDMKAHSGTVRWNETLVVRVRMEKDPATGKFARQDLFFNIIEARDKKAPKVLGVASVDIAEIKNASKYPTQRYLTAEIQSTKVKLMVLTINIENVEEAEPSEFPAGGNELTISSSSSGGGGGGGGNRPRSNSASSKISVDTPVTPIATVGHMSVLRALEMMEEEGGDNNETGASMGASPVHPVGPSKLTNTISPPPLAIDPSPSSSRPSSVSSPLVPTILVQEPSEVDQLAKAPLPSGTPSNSTDVLVRVLLPGGVHTTMKISPDVSMDEVLTTTCEKKGFSRSACLLELAEGGYPVDLSRTLGSLKLTENVFRLKDLSPPKPEAAVLKAPATVASSSSEKNKEQPQLKISTRDAVPEKEGTRKSFEPPSPMTATEQEDLPVSPDKEKKSMFSLLSKKDKDHKEPKEKDSKKGSSTTTNKKTDDELAHLAGENENLKKQLAARTAEVEALKSHIVTKKAQSVAQTTENDSLRLQIKKLTSVDAEKAKLQSEVKALHENNEELKRKQSKLERQQSVSLGSQGQLQKDYDQSQQHLKQAQGETQNLQRKVASLTEEVNNLRQNLSSSHGELQAQMLAQQDAMRATHAADIAQLEQELSDVINDREEATKKHREAVDLLKADIDDLQIELERRVGVDQQLAAARDEVARLVQDAEDIDLLHVEDIAVRDAKYSALLAQFDEYRSAERTRIEASDVYKESEDARKKALRALAEYELAERERQSAAAQEREELESTIRVLRIQLKIEDDARTLEHNVAPNSLVVKSLRGAEAQVVAKETGLASISRTLLVAAQSKVRDAGRDVVTDSDFSHSALPDHAIKQPQPTRHQPKEEAVAVFAAAPAFQTVFDTLSVTTSIRAKASVEIEAKERREKLLRGIDADSASRLAEQRRTLLSSQPLSISANDDAAASDPAQLARELALKRQAARETRSAKYRQLRTGRRQEALVVERQQVALLQSTAA